MSQIQTITLSTGIQVKVKKVSPFTLAAVQKRYPPPRPPMAPGVGGELEPNDADPDYLQALEDHTALRSEKVMQALFALGLDVEIDQAALTEFKASMAALDIEITGDDKQVYIRHIAIGTKEDMDLISQAVTRTTLPTEEAVQEHLDTFSGPISGPERDGHLVAEIGHSL